MKNIKVLIESYRATRKRIEEINSVVTRRKYEENQKRDRLLRLQGRLESQFEELINLGSSKIYEIKGVAKFFNGKVLEFDFNILLSDIDENEIQELITFRFELLASNRGWELKSTLITSISHFVTGTINLT